MTRFREIIGEYESRYKVLRGVASDLEVYLKSYLTGVQRVDRVAARAKSPERFAAKATKVYEDGSERYPNPFTEIQDQIGARITVFYLSDVAKVEAAIRKYFKFIEVKSKAPLSDYEFGYFGLHFIICMPDDLIPDDSEEIVPEFFELQIKTLFQHAWSEAHHDLGYKSIRGLMPEERRKIAFTAAQAWGADEMFDELAKSLVNDNEPIP
ncbi:hypothetical protein CA233_22615 [Sphingomonas sp. ABOLD]|uniref:PpGpp synthetase/RelA/SpoT-type nucleotidyltransferase n=1 Tax=Sphingomonas trueperi TaxID=53317 RepID=A0A7X6BBI4_9SPHN|nr:MULTISPECIES: RelA/SpoT domain-containing protein [Sphingomonas]NJB96558.1 ppGpp synthetase/RelA/SpoT-type nucleotidyltransferase [Sphingomonas trueperi]RSV36430.1 hypothetical protein CA233_22615 [Sphingomonas sp. ABOLD]